ncbi:MAG TPA: hypothetical protein VEF34_02690 [Syntrophobacteraceae bacterium]|nr:hypothetical protein [Syntrophobacteraceae bacterium]
MKRGAVIGMGSVLLVAGLAGLGLLQTGMIYPPSSSGPPEVGRPAVSEPGVPQAQVPANLTQEGGTGSSVQAPRSGSSANGGGAVPGNGRASTQTGQASTEAGQASTEAGQPAPRSPTAEKQVPVPRAGEGERRYSGPERPHPKKQLSEARRPAAHARTAGRASARPAKRGSQGPLVIRFNFDPARKRCLDVAQVHLGDKIRINVHKVGLVNRRVYFTFLRRLNSEQGALLELKTMGSFEPVAYRRCRGHYEVEVKIYPGNRWNLMPRSFV